MDCFAVKINFLTHNIAQGKRKDSLTIDDSPSPSNNINEVVIQGFSGKGKDMVRIALGELVFHSVSLRAPFV